MFLRSKGRHLPPMRPNLGYLDLVREEAAQ